MRTESVKKLSECQNLIGLKLTIAKLSGEDDPYKHAGKSGIITHIDSYGQIHGTWNGLAVIPELDEFIVSDDKNNITYISEKF